MRKTIIWMAIICILGIIVVSQIYKHHEPDTTNVTGYAKIGIDAPSFSLKTLQGQTYSLTDAKGKPLVLNFWNAWCGPCKQETPDLIDLYKKYKGKFQLYGINVTNDDSLGAVKLFVKHFDMNYPVLLDKTGEVAHHYNIVGRPITYFIDANGVVVDVIKGYQPEKLKKEIETLISK